MKKIKTLLVVISALFVCVSNAQMVLTYNIPYPNQPVSIPLGGTVNVTVDWGDSSPIETFTSPGNKPHTYKNEGQFQVTISGSLTAYGSSTADNFWLSTVESWDGLGITSFSNAFYFAGRLSKVPNSLPNTVTNIGGMFYFADNFNQPIGSWNTSSITNMATMFVSAKRFNQSLSSWNTSSVTNMKRMFESASAFNQDISGWNTALVTDMSYMFSQATKYNQPLNSWNTASVKDMSYMFWKAINFNQPIENWITNSVTSMSRMFEGATAFNQALDLWNVSSSSTFNNMFSGAVKFNQNLGIWNLKSTVDMLNMLDNSGFTCDNYYATLQGWVNNPTCPVSRKLGAIGLKYNVDNQSRSLLVKTVAQGGKGWTISGDIVSSECVLSSLENSSEISYTVSPNPSEGIYFIECSKPMAEITVCNMQGELIYQSNTTGQKTAIDISNFSEGIYYIKVDGVTKKVFKK